MAGARAAFSPDSKETQEFMSRTGPQAPRFHELAATLQSALEKPDIRPSADKTTGEGGKPEQPTHRPADPATMELKPEAEPRKVGRPLEGSRPKVEKTFTLDADVHKRIARIANMDGLRLDSRFSVSAVLQHLVEYALAHTVDNQVMPGPDGLGLVIRRAEGDDK